ncbi:TPA: glycosyltransferase family 4 protein [Vibrio alginolyticus]|uniref:glycosyltransferase family 4 protein n=1 Tax=Vibrio alginolyticus TaxID=663 RepID=UPI001A33BCA4|nr:glycosyltransferase family 4 protein [Vibrio alginolyticus]EGQ7649183.1 glycosyltransferase family 4 protein [Vibrio alginolyticus]MBS9989395.1 glycosyltransferase family 4 protein [Vibrio alginolyticus]MBT0076874.1 glycosyltransferase family 4 protein [Vibrio alginolyticus]
MKIHFYIANLRAGGTQRVTTLLANFFSKRNDVRIIVNDLSKGPYFEIENKINITDMGLGSDGGSIVRRIFSNIKKIIYIRSEIKRDKPDVIIAQQVEQCIRVSIASFLLNSKVICCEHSEYYAISSRVVRFFRNFIYFTFVDDLFVLTEIDKNQYPKVLQSKISVVPNPLSYSTGLSYEAMREKKEKLIISVGRLSKEKGFDRLIKFVSLNRDIFSEWKVEIIGGGEEYHSLKESIDKLGVEDIITLVGQVKDVKSYYERASIYIMTSIYEGFGLVLIEAMQSFSPIIAFDSSLGARTIVNDKKNGFLIKDNDWKNFRYNLDLLMSDHNLRENLARNANRDSNAYRIEEVMNKWSVYLK